MTDLSVTDVQRILRHHAALGHDVISKPYRTVLTDQYGEAQEHIPYVQNLRVAKSSRTNELHSLLNAYLPVGERPAVVDLSSKVTHEPKPYLNSRFAVFKLPTLSKSEGTDNISDFGVHPFRTDSYPEGPDDYMFLYSGASKHEQESIHSYMKRAEKGPIQYLIRDADQKPRIEKTNQSGWNHAEAIKRLHEGIHTPEFSGLLTVTHNLGVGNYKQYIYDPKTEQLIRHV